MCRFGNKKWGRFCKIVRRERVNLSPRVNTSKLFEFKKKLNATPDAGEDDLDFNIDSNFMDNLNENTQFSGIIPQSNIRLNSFSYIFMN
jgi:hypothetical protein